MDSPRHPARTAGRLARLLLLGAVSGLAAGCAGPGWYAQAAAGQLELMRAREDAAEVMADPETDPVLARRLATAAAIRTFAENELGLPAGDSYRQWVRTGRDAVTWNVVATPEFSLEPKRWCFPVSGCVPYLGWFDAARARTYADRLARRGFDVTVAPAVAYSTLGWFDDPLTDTLLVFSDERLAAYLFHELAHRRLWVAGDADFSESYASFVEEVAVETWLQQTGRAERLPGWRRLRREAAGFDRLLGETREALAAVYAREGEPGWKRQRKAEIFRQLADRYGEWNRQRGDGRDPYGEWFLEPPNNARLALQASYRSGYCAFRALYREAGGDLRHFSALAEERAGLDATARRAWLEQPCEVIAP